MFPLGLSSDTTSIKSNNIIHKINNCIILLTYYCLSRVTSITIVVELSRPIGTIFFTVVLLLAQMKEHT